MPITFSIITCTWNGMPYLNESIASVLAQDYPHVEYIFVDGGSTDGSLETIRASQRPYRLIENVRGGVSHAMNAGMRIATGDVIAHMHADDYYLKPDVLAKVARHLESSGRGWLFGRTKSIKHGVLCSEDFVAPRYSYANLLRGNFIPHAATFVRRELMKAAGEFNPDLRYAMDYELWLRLAVLSEPLQLDEAFAAFREHDGSLSHRNRLAAMREDFCVRLAFAEGNLFARAAHYARYVVRRHRALREGARA